MVRHQPSQIDRYLRIRILAALEGRRADLAVLLDVMPGETTIQLVIVVDDFERYGHYARRTSATRSTTVAADTSSSSLY